MSERIMKSTDIQGSSHVNPAWRRCLNMLCFKYVSQIIIHKEQFTVVGLRLSVVGLRLSVVGLQFTVFSMNNATVIILFFRRGDPCDRPYFLSASKISSSGAPSPDDKAQMPLEISNPHLKLFL